MDKPVVREEALDLTVRFVGGPPIDDVVYAVRRWAERYGVNGTLTAVLEPKSTVQGKVYEVRLERPERVLVIERDRNLMLAIRHAFERLPVSAVVPMAAAAGAGARRTSA
jgi:hypothetical protein